MATQEEIDAAAALAENNTIPPVDDTGGASADTALAEETGAVVRAQPEAIVSPEGTPASVQTALAENIPTYIPPTDGVSGVTRPKASDYSSAETSVSAQLDKLLNRDSAISQTQRRASREGASALGMMSSTQAIGETNSRNVAALSGVAKADAEINSKFALQEQQLDNKIAEIEVEAQVSGNLLVQKAEIADRAQQVAAEWELIYKDMDRQTQFDISEYQGQLALDQKELEGEISKEIQKSDLDAETRQTIINNGSEAMTNHNISIQELMVSETFMDGFGGNKGAMYAYFDDMFAGTAASLRLQAKTAGLYDSTDDVEGLDVYIRELVADSMFVTTKSAI